MGQKLVTGACPCVEPSVATPTRDVVQKPAIYDEHTPPGASVHEFEDSVDRENEAAGVFVSIPADESLDGFDREQPVFKGMIVEQKFHNKTSYDRRLAWIKLEARTLCLSEYESTNRKHKEARISDITGLVAGPPDKIKATVADSAALMNGGSWDCYLSIKFQRGGGVDLRFRNRTERDMWLDALTRLMRQQATSNGEAAAATLIKATL